MFPPFLLIKLNYVCFITLNNSCLSLLPFVPRFPLSGMIPDLITKQIKTKNSFTKACARFVTGY
jgi:hypothetical protein